MPEGYGVMTQVYEDYDENSGEVNKCHYRLEGNFEQGELSGIGKLESDSGLKQIGEFKRGMLHGRGLFDCKGG
jgi:hypothetical protein